MKMGISRLALLFATVATACSARTPLDPHTHGAANEEGGAIVNSGGGGSAGSGGSHSDGGAAGSGGIGARGGSGGTIRNTGGTISTGGVHTDGGFSGSIGGSAGTIVLGGRGGANTGGSLVRAGGAIGAGGSLGGSAGTIGRDGGPDSRPDVLPDLPPDTFGRDVGRELGAGGVVATGGNGAGGSTGADASVCPSPASNEDLIDDLNDGDRFLPMSNGRLGAWTGSHDNSPSGKMSPDPSSGFSPTNTGDPCRKYAMYVSGTGYVLWGADFWFGLGSPYDASKFNGISFWAKIDPGTLANVRIAFPDKDTLPDGNLCSTASTAGSNACYDHYGYRLTLSTTWTKYTIPFSALTTGNWGRGGSGFDPATLYQVLFQLSATSTFGIWVDDVAFTF